MSVVVELKEQLEGTQTARFVTTVLRDISATKLQEIKEAFDKNTLYYEEMRDLDALVQTYALRNALLEKESTQNGQIFVALTSNKRFAGMLNRDIIERLTGRMDKDDSSSFMVIGRTGRTYLEGSPYEDRFQYYEFESDSPTSAEARKLLKRLSEFDQVYVFCPKFINPFRQEVSLIDITHKPEPKKAEELNVDYIFEPEIIDLLAFFEDQIRFILFNRVLLETKLAQTGARLTKMQRARERAKEMVGDLRHTIHKEENALESMHLLETFAGFHKEERL